MTNSAGRVQPPQDVFNTLTTTTKGFYATVEDGKFILTTTKIEKSLNADQVAQAIFDEINKSRGYWDYNSLLRRESRLKAYIIRVESSLNFLSKLFYKIKGKNKKLQDALNLIHERLPSEFKKHMKQKEANYKLFLQYKKRMSPALEKHPKQLETNPQVLLKDEKRLSPALEKQLKRLETYYQILLKNIDQQKELIEKARQKCDSASTNLLYAGNESQLGQAQKEVDARLKYKKLRENVLVKLEKEEEEFKKQIDKIKRGLFE